VLLLRARLGALQPTEELVSRLWAALCGPGGLRSGRGGCRAAAAAACARLSLAAPLTLPAAKASDMLLRQADADTRAEVRRECLVSALLLLQAAPPDVLQDAALPLLAACARLDDAELRCRVGSLLRRALPGERVAELVLGGGAASERSLLAAAEALRLALLPPASAGALGNAAAQLAGSSAAEAAAAALADSEGGAAAALDWLAALEASPAGAGVGALRFARLTLRRLLREPPAAEAVLRALHAALAQLQPPAPLCDGFAELPGDGRAFAAAAAPRLQLLEALLPLLPPASLWPRRLAAPAEGEAWPHGGEGVAEGGPRAGPACALAAAALAGGGSLAADAEAADGLPPWSGAEAAAAAESLLRALQACWQASGGEGGGGGMLSCSLAARAPTLRAALLPAGPAADSLPAEGEARAAALRAAQALRAALSRLRHPWASCALPAAHPPLLLALEALPPACRAHGALAAAHVAAHATRTALRAAGGALAAALLQRLTFQREPAAAWPLAVRAAAALALPLGDAPRGQLLRALAASLAQLPGDAHCARPALRALPPLVRAEGLRLLLLTRDLLPALLEWVAQAEEAGARADAAEALTACLEVTWPRAPAHAPQIWPALLAGLRACSGGGGDEARCAAALERVARQLHAAAGAAFRKTMVVDAANTPLAALLAALQADAADAEAAAAAASPPPPPDIPAAETDDVQAHLDAWAAGDPSALLKEPAAE